MFLLILVRKTCKYSKSIALETRSVWLDITRTILADREISTRALSVPLSTMSIEELRTLATRGLRFLRELHLRASFAHLEPERHIMLGLPPSIQAGTLSSENSTPVAFNLWRPEKAVLVPGGRWVLKPSYESAAPTEDDSPVLMCWDLDNSSETQSRIGPSVVMRPQTRFHKLPRCLLSYREREDDYILLLVDDYDYESVCFPNSQC